MPSNPFDLESRDVSKSTHIKRYYRYETADGASCRHDDPGAERDEDTWVDVQRIDECNFMFWHGAQKVKFSLARFWENPTDPGPDRKFKYAKVMNPEDREQFVYCLSFKEFAYRSHGMTDQGMPPSRGYRPMLFGPRGNDNVAGQKLKFNFRDGPPEKLHRVKRAARIVHTPIDEEELAPQTVAGLSEPGGEDIFQTDQYSDVFWTARDAGEEDEDQYVNFAVIDNYGLKSGQGYTAQIHRVTLHNEYMFDEMFRQTSEGADAADDDPKKPVRLDPFQNIVNVSWGGLAVEFYEKAT